MWSQHRDDIMIAFPPGRSHPFSGRHQGSAEVQPPIWWVTLGESQSQHADILQGIGKRKWYLSFWELRSNLSLVWCHGNHLVCLAWDPGKGGTVSSKGNPVHLSAGFMGESSLPDFWRTQVRPGSWMGHSCFLTINFYLFKGIFLLLLTFILSKASIIVQKCTLKRHLRVEAHKVLVLSNQMYLLWYHWLARAYISCLSWSQVSLLPSSTSSLLTPASQVPLCYQN